MPLIYRRQRALGVPEREIPAIARQHYRSSWIRTRLLMQEAGRTTELLRAQGVDTLVLKGAALVAAYYRDPGARPMLDFDVLVHPSDAARAAEILERDGWRSTPPFAEWVTKVRHAVNFEKGEHQCDLHWYALSHSRGDSADEAFWAGSVETSFQSLQLRVLRAEHQLLHVIEHGTRTPASVIWAIDAITIVRSAPSFDWASFAGETEARGLEYPVGEVIDYLARTFALSVPDGVVRRLTARSVSRLERFIYAQPGSTRTRGALFVVVASFAFKLGRQPRLSLAQRVLWVARSLKFQFGVSSVAGIFRALAASIMRRVNARLKRI